MFPKYHQFRGCKTLRSTIENLQCSNNIPGNIYDNYCRYHYSVVNKLHFAYRNYQELVNVVSDPNAAINAITNAREFLLPVNYWLDGFLHFCVSATDIFARDVLCYYDLIPTTGNVYFRTAWDVLNGRNPTNQLLPRLIPPSWLSELREYRNWSTHEEVVTDTIGVAASVIGPNNRNIVALQLPDSPHIHPKTYHRRIVMINYCNKNLMRILRTFNQIYIEINNLAIANGSLPLIP